MMPDTSAVAIAGLKSRLLRLSGAIVGLATAAEVLGKSVNAIEKLRHMVIDTIGLQQMVNIHQALVIIVGVALLIGYAAAAWWVYLKIRAQRMQLRIAYVLLAVAGMGTMAWINYRIIPPRPDPETYLRTERTEWERRVLGSQESAHGGIRVTSLDQTAPTQVWTTAQVLAGVLSDGSLGATDVDRVRKAFNYMESARLGGTGGWGYFEDWPWSITEVTSWVALSEALSLQQSFWSASERADMTSRVRRDLKTVALAQQEGDKGWSPVISSSPNLSRTYSTLMATLAFAEAQHAGVASDDDAKPYDMYVRNGAEWLLRTFDTQPRSDNSALPTGWVANPSRVNQQESFLGLNAQVLYILERAARLPRLDDLRLNPNFKSAVGMFLAETTFQSRAVGLNDRLHDSDRYLPGSASLATISVTAHATCSCPLTIEGSTFLWYPWSVAAARALADDGELQTEQRQRAATLARQLVQRLSDSSSFVSGGFNYVNAEFLLGVTPTRHETAPLRASVQ
jgi:hypothetical protein